MTAELPEAWRQAQDLWRVRLADLVQGHAADLGSFAAYSMPPRVHIDLADIDRRGIRAHLMTILAHEVGHHVLAPATRVDSLKITHQMARALAVSATVPIDVPRSAALLANLWCDMLINVRVARMQARTGGGEPDMVRLWRTLGRGMAQSRLGWVVMRAYEHLWSVPAGGLCPRQPRPAPEPQHRKRRAASEQVAAELRALVGTDPQGDALLLADAVRTFGADPVTGALTAGLLLGPYLATEPQEAGACGGAVEALPLSAAELEDVLRDPRLQSWPAGSVEGHEAEGATEGDTGPEVETSAGQGYGLAETLALYDGVAEDVVMSAWYRSRAQRWVRPLREARDAVGGEEIPGPRTTWEVGEDVEEIDWPATLELGPVVVPGVTTRRRETVPDEPRDELVPIQLDLYIDSSGSMRRPQQDSPAVLAATILLEAVLRSGGRVRVASFSSAGQVSGSEGYTRNRSEAMAHVLTYFGHGTTFPLDLLARRYLEHSASVPRRKYLVVLSDDGLESFFGRGQDAFAHVAPAVGRLLDTGTLVLVVSRVAERTRHAATEAGYGVVHVPSVDDAPRACAALAERLAQARITA